MFEIFCNKKCKLNKLAYSIYGIANYYGSGFKRLRLWASNKLSRENYSYFSGIDNYLFLSLLNTTNSFQIHYVF